MQPYVATGAWELWDMLAGLIENTGPDLTPASMAAAASSMGTIGGGATGHAEVGFSKGSYNWTIDAAVVSWSKGRPSSYNGKPGTFVDIEGSRFLPQSFPKLSEPPIPKARLLARPALPSRLLTPVVEAARGPSWPARVGRWLTAVAVFVAAIELIFGLSAPDFVSGLALGSLYGIIGVGIVHIYRTARTINFRRRRSGRRTCGDRARARAGVRRQLPGCASDRAGGGTRPGTRRRPGDAPVRRLCLSGSSPR